MKKRNLSLTVLGFLLCLTLLSSSGWTQQPVRDADTSNIVIPKALADECAKAFIQLNIDDTIIAYQGKEIQTAKKRASHILIWAISASAVAVVSTTYAILNKH